MKKRKMERSFKRNTRKREKSNWVITQKKIETGNIEEEGFLLNNIKILSKCGRIFRDIYLAERVELRGMLSSLFWRNSYSTQEVRNHSTANLEYLQYTHKNALTQSDILLSGDACGYI